MAVVDRWHKSKPEKNEPTCDHDKVAAGAHGNGPRWQVRWRDENGRQRKKNFTTKGPADVFDVKQRSDVHHGTSVDVVAAREHVSRYFERWLTGLLWRDTSRAACRSMFTCHIEPVIGTLAVGQVRASHIRTILKRASSTLGTSSLSQLRTYLAMLFRAAVADRIIGTSPVENVSTPAPSRNAHVIPTVDQCHAAAGALPENLSAIAYVASGCGLRIGEILGLEVEHIDFLRRTVTVTQQLVAPNKGAPYIAEPKTKTSSRVVELPEIVAVALAEHLRSYPADAAEIVDRTDPRTSVTREARLVFTSPHGGPVRRRYWSDAWKSARNAAGLGDGVGVHALRHFYASSLIHAGASVKQVQTALGHSKPSITLDVYTHLWPDTEGHTRKIVDGALGTIPPRKINPDVPSSCPDLEAVEHRRSIER
jgi:integrase